MKDTLSIKMGALAPEISTQLKEQGFKFSAEKAKEFQTSLDSIIILQFADVLTDSDSEKCRKRLFNNIKKHIIAVNKLQGKN